MADSTQQQQVQQPTVRVMRLYKPALHLNLVNSSLPSSYEDNVVRSSDFLVSQYLLLPDNFGDIYVGELFSAYVAVLNGVQEKTFANVSVSIRLQTANAFYDLVDLRPTVSATTNSIQPKTLKPAESLDVVVRHQLGELGQHTMRVSVEYIDTNTGESKTMRKFYRFNVLNALVIRSKVTKVLKDKCMVQCQVVNSTKSSIFLKETKLVCSNDSLNVQMLCAPTSFQPGCLITQSANSMDGSNSTAAIENVRRTAVSDVSEVEMERVGPFLAPDESYAFGFVVSKGKEAAPVGEGVAAEPLHSIASNSTGFIQIHWAEGMGEHGFARGEDMVLSLSPEVAKATLQVSQSAVTEANRSSSLQVSVISLSSPVEARVGEIFQVSIKVKNIADYPIIAQLQSKASLEDPAGICVTGLSFINLGTLEVGEAVSLTLQLCSLGPGMHELRSLAVYDSVSGREYLAGSLCKVFVYDDDLPKE